MTQKATFAERADKMLDASTELFRIAELIAQEAGNMHIAAEKFAARKKAQK